MNQKLQELAADAALDISEYNRNRGRYWWIAEVEKRIRQAIDEAVKLEREACMDLYDPQR